MPVPNLTPAQRKAFEEQYPKPKWAKEPVTLGPDSPYREAPVRTKKRQHRQHEHEQQVAFFRAIDADPRLRDLPIFAIPNGGHRHPAVAARLKAEGVRSGVPDIFVAVSDLRPGLFIEMKAGKNKQSPNQVEWMRKLGSQGYHCCVCYSAADALRDLLEYLALAPRP